MKLVVLKETAARETRAAISADAVKKYVALGMDVEVQQGAALASGVTDDVLEAAGAKVSANPDVTSADILLAVQRPDDAVTSKLKKGAKLIGMLAPYAEQDGLKAIGSAGVEAFALELLPRTSRAQAMDVLSSQSNLAGYRTVLLGANHMAKLFPMLMTSAGTVAPAKVLVIGAGVAGLQAIATAKRLGAVVSAFDVRTAAKEQVQSLGAKFIEVKDDSAADAETSGGYAKEMSEDYKKKQGELLAATITTQDLVITTALIPGRPAPVLITEEMVKSMKEGAVIVDMAAAAGGNCALSKADEVTKVGAVTILAPTDLPAQVAADATPLYARNLSNFIANLFEKTDEGLKPRWEDDLVQGTLLSKDGAMVHSIFNAA